MRFARQYVLLHPRDCDPPHGLDLAPDGRDARKVGTLLAAFLTAGFDPEKPAIVGYPLNGRVQPVAVQRERETILRDLMDRLRPGRGRL